MTKFNNTLLLGWCDDRSCSEPIYGAAGQRCPKFCLPCAVRRVTGIKQPGGHPDDPTELNLDADYRQLRDSSDEENQD